MANLEWDIFISYAREDEDMVAQLGRLLVVFDLKVWLDLNELRAAQSLPGKIGEGIAASRFGVAILSPAYEPKEWPNREFTLLLDLDAQGKCVLIPVWYKLDAEAIERYNRRLHNRKAVKSDKTDSNWLIEVATQILNVVIPLRAAEIGFPLDHLYYEDRNVLDGVQTAFNRPVFKGPFLAETLPDGAQQAFKIITKALATGVLNDRTGNELKRIKPILSIRDVKLKALLQDVADKVKHCDVTIDVMSKAQATRAQTREIAVMEECNKQIARHLETLNVVRDDIIVSLNKVWKCFGIHTLPIPTEDSTTTQSYGPQHPL
jgi:hypothetical protein